MSMCDCACRIAVTRATLQAELDVLCAAPHRPRVNALAPSDPDFVAVQRRIEHTDALLGDSAVVVVGVHRVVHTGLLARQLASRVRAMAEPSASECTTLFYPSSPLEARAIAQHGFQLCGAGPFGRGVYLHSDVQTCVQLCTRGPSDTLDWMVVCGAHVGRLKAVSEPSTTYAEPAQRVMFTYDTLAIQPSVARVPLQYRDAYVVYDPGLVLPQYLVACQRKGVVAGAQGAVLEWPCSAPLVAPLTTTIARDQYELGSREDNMFRLVESQYLRCVVPMAAAPAPPLPPAGSTFSPAYLTRGKGRKSRRGVVLPGGYGAVGSPPAAAPVGKVHWRQHPALQTRYDTAFSAVGEEDMAFLCVDSSTVDAVFSDDVHTLLAAITSEEGAMVLCKQPVLTEDVRSGATTLVLCKVVMGPCCDGNPVPQLGHISGALLSGQPSSTDFAVLSVEQILPFAAVELAKQ